MNTLKQKVCIIEESFIVAFAWLSGVISTGSGIRIERYLFVTQLNKISKLIL